MTAGLFASQEALEDDTQLARRLLTVDFANTVVFCEEARKRLLAPAKGPPAGRCACSAPWPASVAASR